jgi:hypothetical protein
VAAAAGRKRGEAVKVPERIDVVKTARLAGAALALLVAVAVVFVAEDVRRWPARIEAGDVRYVSGSATEDWQPSDRLPFRLGDDFLDVDDDLALRRALVLFRRERESGDENRSASEHIQLQSLLEQALIDLEAGAEDQRRRSHIANLLGLLYFDMAQSAGPAGEAFFGRTLAAWRRAVILDPTNVDAKANLEIFLTLMSEPEEIRSIRFGRGTSQRGGGQVGLRPPGGGY